jgi:hypothetical protein
MTASERIREARRNPALTALCRKYRNPVKRQYAEDYADYLDGFRDVEPERPANLSYMAAQAVRLTLAS